MSDLAIAYVLHVLGVVIWIGGVSMVTAVILPARYASAEERMRVFEAVESRFAWIARAMTLLVGFSGLYLIWKLNLWDRFSYLSYWWMHAMICVWALFTFLLFVAEQMFLHRRFLQRARKAPESTFRLAQRLHWILLLARRTVRLPKLYRKGAQRAPSHDPRLSVAGRTISDLCCSTA